MSALYRDLRHIAARYLRGERPEHTLQTTALIHEAYVRLLDSPQWRFTDRAHFLAVASRVMRQVLVDYARARATKKRGGAEGHLQRGEWTTTFEVEGQRAMTQLELLELDRALEALASQDESLARVIEMRYFGGMTAEETASLAVLLFSPRFIRLPGLSCGRADGTAEGTALVKDIVRERTAPTQATSCQGRD